MCRGVPTICSLFQAQCSSKNQEDLQSKVTQDMERREIGSIQLLNQLLSGKLTLLGREDGENITKGELGDHLGRQTPFLWG